MCSKESISKSAKGRLVSIMGASGSGKSTLLNILGILDDYDSGNYYLNGQLIKNPSETRAAEISQQPDRIHLPVFQPHQLQKCDGERGIASLL